MYSKPIIDAECTAAIKKIAGGDVNALTVIYDRLHRLIYSVAWSVLKSHEDAEDVLQATLIEVVKSAKSFRGGSGRGWVTALARNIALNTLRSKRDTLELDEETSVTNDESFIGDITCADALARLELTSRQIVVMKLYGGFKFREIAEILAMNIDAVESNYRRSLKKLRTYYQ